ncbi:acyl-CoA thioesterase [Jeotgalibacillus haloalkalitolerans]|uniref:Acyl-CoA thioesterase n=1 Tax=Jeotgalibacillus haloalkalitolerans TaxID=3104292 RepID=A0ABU5KQ85_9BACL|nr:acyl-CoA thioesterase [Jeotgalibacillus sp. HH7-29]MDZ5713404.1 acyl-CoA thioesterase [Jeotgalibacillus sp. HH7-29]
MKKTMKESRTIQTSHVLPPDTNHHGTLFGGQLMAYIDNVASIAATKHSRSLVVTASTDSVDFLKPIRVGDAVTLEAFVSYTGKSSMEVFVRVTTENLLSGDQSVAAISFLTFVAIDNEGKPIPVPDIVPETEEERWLNETAENRAEHRKARKLHSQELAAFFTPKPHE